MADAASTKAADLPRDVYVMYKKKFDNFDLNKDGIISVAEFTSVSKVFGYSLTDEDIKEIFGKIDGNEDGGICFDEFVAAMQKRAKKVKDMAPLREQFRLYDTKQRGYITTDEAYPVLSRELGFDENKTGTFVDMFDKNKDYQLSLLEFVAFQKRVEELKAQIEVAFKECDTDNDGFISAAELNVVMSKKGQSMSEAEAVIAKYDINGDGKLDYQEFAAYYDIPIF